MRVPCIINARSTGGKEEGRFSQNDNMAKEKEAKKAFVLRMAPNELEALQRWADDEFRSLNGQIEYLLHEALKAKNRLPREKGGQSD